MEANDPLSASEARLSRMDFSGPICSCQSSGNFTNSQGQEFTITVIGFDTDRMQEYTKNARVEMEVVPLDQARPEEQIPKSEEEELEEIQDPGSGGDLDITVEIVSTAGVELPYVLYVTIDPPIAEGEVHRYLIASSATAVRVKVTADSGGVRANLYRGRNFVRGRRADTVPPDPPNINAYLPWESPAPSKYSLKVKGLTANNSYTYSASVING
jgi:hypothetical protein